MKDGGEDGRTKKESGSLKFIPSRFHSLTRQFNFT